MTAGTEIFSLRLAFAWLNRKIEFKQSGTKNAQGFGA
jgi:hypothetical protein